MKIEQKKIINIVIMLAVVLEDFIVQVYSRTKRQLLKIK
jgi:hypothetical protein